MFGEAINCRPGRPRKSLNNFNKFDQLAGPDIEQPSGGADPRGADGPA
jgi:hypothetical protein